ncbi:RAD55 family ATPase [Pseudoduganella sp. GCM10020061]|uniref:RAD55 family ATPase n=1 Tax=Pseudoduganella sp. GCM10020061 TaxID=3317345 RepID=UPI003634038B
MSDKVSLGTLETGVPGLDVLLGGGLPEFSFNLIAGAPGSGKTTLAHQMMFSLAGPKCKALFFTVLGEPPLKMLRYQQQFSFFDLDKVGESIRYVNLAEDLRSGDFGGVLERVMREVEDFGPSLVFVDSFRSVVQTGRAGNEGIADLQYFVQELGTRMTSWQATTFLIGEYLHADVEANPIMTVADGVISLAQVQQGNAVVRKMRVIKMRGQGHMTGAHSFRISDDGLRVYPRVVPRLKTGPSKDHITERVSLGVATLDEMFGGGLPRGHSLLVSGSSGCGKTILCNSFLEEGARQGEKSVAIYFEKGTSRMRNVRLARLVESGHVSVIDSETLDLTVEQMLDELVHEIKRIGARRVVIDSLSEFELHLAPEFREDFRTTVFSILATLSSLGVTVIATVGQIDMFTELRFSEANVSFLTDAILIMRYVELEGRIAKVMSVIKVRGSAHSTDLREYVITDKGIEIGASPHRFEGLLSGRPTHTARKG